MCPACLSKELLRFIELLYTKADSVGLERRSSSSYSLSCLSKEGRHDLMDHMLHHNVLCEVLREEGIL